MSKTDLGDQVDLYDLIVEGRWTYINRALEGWALASFTFILDL